MVEADGGGRSGLPADDAVRASVALLEALGLGKSAVYERSTTSAVTTSWGVRWDEENIARDLLQNFYDANRGELGRVTIDAGGEVVRVAGPAAHDLEQLFYLGSEKDPAANVGQYGEGFKAAAMCLVRDFGIHPVARSGDRAVCIRLSAESVVKTKLRPLVYDWFKVAKSFSGTELVLPHTSPKLRAAMQTGLSHFLYEGNPLMGRKRWESYDGAFALYDSPERGRGAIFYRNLRRAVVPDIPVVLVIDKSYTRIEKLIQSDRDRNAFGEKLIKIFYEIFARSALKGVRDAQQIIVEAARPVWSRGHALLAAISEAGRFWSAWPEATARKVFGDRFYARAHPNNASEHLRFEAVEKRWQGRDGNRSPGTSRSLASRTPVLTSRRRSRRTSKRAAGRRRAQSGRPSTSSCSCCGTLPRRCTPSSPRTARRTLSRRPPRCWARSRRGGATARARSFSPSVSSRATSRSHSRPSSTSMRTCSGTTATGASPMR